MSDDRSPLIERIFERTVRIAGGGRLHPLEILAEVERAATAGVRAGAMPNQFRVRLNPRDYASYENAFPELQREIDTLLAGLERRTGSERIGDRLVAFEREPALPVGEVEVTAGFANTEHRPPPAPFTATERIELHTGLSLVLGDGTSAALDHTPFSIGRAPGNDLVLLSMAVSRTHARVIREGDGFVIEDAGSRNGVISGGLPQARVRLDEGVTVSLGDIDLRLERGR
ncbi:MAG: FhaA domain-containing protein [Dehalococcoidia bacterium]